MRQPATRSFERFAGVCAILTAVAGFFYSVAFALLARVTPNVGETLSWLLLLLGGLLAIPALVAVYRRLRETDAGFALLGFMLGFAGAIGSAVHGAYEVGVALHPAPRPPDLPNAIDPRGFLTFGVAGLGLFVVAWLITNGGAFPRSLGYLGYVSAALLVVIYLGRLIILEATNLAVILPAIVEGFLVNPLWYLMLGVELWRPART